jgi:hypothetical protein
VFRVDHGETSATFRFPFDNHLEMFRVRAESTDPLPASYYAGTTNFPGEPASGPLAEGAGGLTRVNNAGVPGATEDATRAVVESDIWVVEGDTLYFFNQYRGLQVVDLVKPDAPVLKGTFPMPGAGEQMYVLAGQRVALLAHDPCNQWGTDSESAVVVVDASVNPPTEVARLPLRGRIVESRKVGNRVVRGDGDLAGGHGWQRRVAIRNLGGLLRSDRSGQARGSRDPVVRRLGECRDRHGQVSVCGGDGLLEELAVAHRIASGGHQGSPGRDDGVGEDRVAGPGGG